MGKSELLLSLRQITRSIEHTDREFWAAPAFSAGVAKGIIAELIGNACTEWLLHLFCLNPEPFIFWCENESKVLPTAILQRGVELHRIKFVRGGNNLHQLLRIALESQHYPFVVAPQRITDVTGFQRLHLLAEKSKSTVFLLNGNCFSQAWPISLQLKINFAEDGFDIFVQRQKHGRAE